MKKIKNRINEFKAKVKILTLALIMVHIYKKMDKEAQRLEEAKKNRKKH